MKLVALQDLRSIEVADGSPQRPQLPARRTRITVQGVFHDVLDTTEDEQRYHTITFAPQYPEQWVTP